MATGPRIEDGRLMTCVDVPVDGVLVRVQMGDDEVTDEERDILTEIVRAAKKREVCPACINPKSCCVQHRTHRIPPYPHTNCILR